MNPINIMRSTEDKSVNFIFDDLTESRFVQRSDDYFITYLSSHNGCNKACRFCHLTQTGQTQMQETSLNGFLDQATPVLKHYMMGDMKASTVHYNFMARGEVLSSRIIRQEVNNLFDQLQHKARELDLHAKFNLSTIMPDDAADLDLAAFISDEFDHQYYYSLYSVDPGFRKRWLPKAMPVDDALLKFKQWQDVTGRDLALHWTFIDGENDSEDSIQSIIHKIESFGLSCKFNLVRYNPFSGSQGKESSDEVLERGFNQMAPAMLAQGSRIIPRVGFDVKASCGMFVS